MPPDRNQVAEKLRELGRLIEFAGESSAGGRPYLRAAEALETMPGTLKHLMAGNRLHTLAGVEEAAAAAIRELYREGRSDLLDRARARVPAGIRELLRIPGLGPERARDLHRKLGIGSPEELESACRQGRLAEREGFGRSWQASILEAVGRRNRDRGRLALADADRRCGELIARLKGSPGVARVEPAGAVRRREPLVSRLEIVAEVSGSGGGGTAGAGRELMALLRPIPGLSAIDPGPGGGRIECHWSGVGSARIYPVSTARFPTELLWRTGSERHLAVLRERAGAAGMRLAADGLFRDGRPVGVADENGVYRALDLPFPPPEVRQGSFEFGPGNRDRIAALLSPRHLRGTFHVHTVWSDGADSLEEMAAGAERLGFEYLGISDHSRSARIANGLGPERLLRQLEEIDEWNRRGNRIRVLKGAEVDILEDGGLDFDDVLLRRLDFVIASVHDRFGMDRDRMTTRILRALENPHVTILGHPTGRLLLVEEPFEFDTERVLNAVAERGVLLELNGSSRRLDPPPEICRRAAELGIRLCVNPDAHQVGAIGDVRYGVEQARRAGLTPDRIANCGSWEEIGASLGHA